MPGYRRDTPTNSNPEWPPCLWVRECQIVGVTDLADHCCWGSRRASEEAAFEGDGERVERWLPAIHQALLTGAFGVERPNDEVEVQRRLLVGKCPRARVARRNRALSDSMAFVEEITRRISGP